MRNVCNLKTCLLTSYELMFDVNQLAYWSSNFKVHDVHGQCECDKTIVIVNLIGTCLNFVVFFSFTWKTSFFSYSGTCI